MSPANKNINWNKIIKHIIPHLMKNTTQGHVAANKSQGSMTLITIRQIIIHT